MTDTGLPQGDLGESDFDPSPGSSPSVGADYASGEALVRAVQGKINALGYAPPLSVDGKWGPKTLAGVSWARAKFGLGPGIGAGGLDDALVKALGLSAGQAHAPLPQGGAPATLPEFASLLAFAQKFGQTVTQGSGIAPGFAATRASVVDSFIPWSGPFEGPSLTYPYTDVDGWVTTGTGNMIDAPAPGQVKGKNCGKGTSAPCGQATPTAKARAMPWTGGSIDADWAAIKAAWPKVQSTACAGITHARLPKDYLVKLATDQMKANEADVLRLVPGFAQLPADAQLALHSMMWAMGSGKLAIFKSLLSAVNSGDFVTAAAQSHMQGDGIDMRNLANKLLFLNAAAVKAAGLSLDHLYYTTPVGGLIGMAASPVALALRLAPKIDSGLVLDAGIVLGCALLGSAAGPLGTVAGVLVGAGISVFRRMRG